MKLHKENSLNLEKSRGSFFLEVEDRKYLHIGCGINVNERWENIDASPSLKISKLPIFGRYISSLFHVPNWPKTVVYGDIVKGLKNRNNSYDLIFAAHILEHLSLSDFHVALGNIHLYLKPNGIFRFIVPDLKQYVDIYIKHFSDSTLSAKAAHDFLECSLLGYTGSRKSLYYRFREALGNSRHQWMWDQPSLFDTIAQYGFRHIRQCHYGDWSDPQFGFVEKEENYLYAIGIEAIK